MSWGKLIGILLSASLLAGCSLATQGSPSEMLNRSTSEAAETPLLRATIPSENTEAMLRPSGQNGDTRTWADSVISLAFQDGILVATRGLDDDLMSADVSASRQALAGGTRQDYSRFASYLDANGATEFRTSICSLSSAGPAQVDIMDGAVSTERFDETCTSLTATVTNSYWIGSDGTMWRSRQWIGDETGYLVTDRLIK